jgi:hypothetical protein
MAFSLFTNIPKWLSTRPSADDLGCLHGIRVLSTTYIVLAHTWYVITFVPFWNSVDVKLVSYEIKKPFVKKKPHRNNNRLFLKVG